MKTIVCPANSWDGRPTSHDELVEVTLVVGGLRLRQDHVLHVQPAKG